jgi:hypothetical protein
MPRVLGYHGCQKAFADGVRSGQITIDQWKPSQNTYDWLGEGIYFWEGSRSRADSWAKELFGDQGDVLEVEIELGECLDLLENTYYNSIRGIFQNLRTVYQSQNWALPKNKKKKHSLDCLVINKFVNFMEKFEGQDGIVFQTVRGLFEEGRPIFPGSAIRNQSHIQVAVRDISCIKLIDKFGAKI